MVWRLALRVGLSVAPLLAKALADGRITPEEVEELASELLAALLVNR